MHLLCIFKDRQLPPFELCCGEAYDTHIERARNRNLQKSSRFFPAIWLVPAHDQVVVLFPFANQVVALK